MLRGIANDSSLGRTCKARSLLVQILKGAFWELQVELEVTQDRSDDHNEAPLVSREMEASEMKEVED